MRPGVRIGVDVGSVRVGVARCDPEGLLATPLVTLRRGKGDLAELVAVVAEHQAVEVVVGLPRTLADRQGAAARAATSYARSLAARLPPHVSVRLVDERLSTVAATRDLRASGLDTRKGRKVIDQAAAVIILQSALDAERCAGSAPGHVLHGGRNGRGAERNGSGAERNGSGAERNGSGAERNGSEAEGNGRGAEGYGSVAEGDGSEATRNGDVGAGGAGSDARVDE
jgi:putative holliday junction resolvase